jgi:hypothetical protein
VVREGKIEMFSPDVKEIQVSDEQKRKFDEVNSQDFKGQFCLVVARHTNIEFGPLYDSGGDFFTRRYFGIVDSNPALTLTPDNSLVVNTAKYTVEENCDGDLPEVYVEEGPMGLWKDRCSLAEWDVSFKERSFRYARQRRSEVLMLEMVFGDREVGKFVEERKSKPEDILELYIAQRALGQKMEDYHSLTDLVGGQITKKREAILRALMVLEDSPMPNEIVGRRVKHLYNEAQLYGMLDGPTVIKRLLRPGKKLEIEVKSYLEGMREQFLLT